VDHHHPAHSTGKISLQRMEEDHTEEQLLRPSGQAKLIQQWNLRFRTNVFILRIGSAVTAQAQEGDSQERE
jgi:hypothetical protein